MSRTFFIGILLLVIGAVLGEAAIYKGQKEFVSKCLQCHDSGQTFVASHTMREWKKLIGKQGVALAKTHLASQKAKESWKYFKSKRFTKKSRHLKQFLVEYAKDSGNVPACN